MQQNIFSSPAAGTYKAKPFTGPGGISRMEGAGGALREIPVAARAGYLPAAAKGTGSGRHQLGYRAGRISETSP